MKHEGQPPERLRRFPLLSQCCARREGGRRQRTPAKRRLCSGAALARRPQDLGSDSFCNRSRSATY